MVATSRVDDRWIGSPSSSTTPPFGFINRASPRSSVDFPHALAPTMTVICPVGTCNERPSTIIRSSYANDSVSATRRLVVLSPFTFATIATAQCS